MSNENYDTTIDQKLSELYEVLTELNTLKEKTSAVQQVVEGLSEAGKSRVAEIETAIGRLLGEIDSSTENVRDVLARSTNEARTTIGQGVAEAKKELAGCVAKVEGAVSTAGKERVDSMKITADAFSKALGDLVRSANEGSARMSNIVAELRGLPIIEELHALKSDNEKLVEEIKQVGASIAKNDESLADARKTVEKKVGALGENLSDARTAITTEVKAQGESLSDAQKNISNCLEQKFRELEALAHKISVAVDAAEERITDKLNDMVTDIANRADNVGSQLRDIEKSLGAAMAERASGIDSKVSSLSEEMKASFVESRRKVSVSTWVIGALVFLLVIALLPTIIEGWKAFVR